MPFPFEVAYQLPIPGNAEARITVYSGLTFLLGPNGSGKTQVLRALRDKLVPFAGARAVRYVSAGRMSHIEQWRSDLDGRHGRQPRYDDATMGSKVHGTTRHLAETALGDFQTLSMRPDLQIKVEERLRKLFEREVFLEWDAGNLKVMFARLTSADKPYSSAREASGLLHLVALLSALYDDEVGALLLDEPEVSLHPQLQAFLHREMLRVSGDPTSGPQKLIIVATHSTEFVRLNRPEDISNLVFTADTSHPPVQVNPEAPELKGKKVRSLLLRLGQAQKLALFCSRPLLVEGPSDEIICGGLNRLLDLYLEAAGSQLVPVIGKGEMPSVVQLMRLTGKEPVLLADADAIADDSHLVNAFVNIPAVNVAATEQGYASAQAFASSVYSDFAAVIDKAWSTTQGLCPAGSIAEDGAPTNTEKRRATFHVLLNTSNQELQQTPAELQLVALRTRFIALLDFLERAGCFVLRKGSIEAYYKQLPTDGRAGKPEAAVEEVETLATEQLADVEARYGDVLRALRYAGRSVVIDETAALKTLILSIAAPAKEALTKDASAESLTGLAIRTVGDKAKLLKLTPIRSEGVEVPHAIDIEIQSKVLDVSDKAIRVTASGNVNVEVGQQLKPKS